MGGESFIICIDLQGGLQEEDLALLWSRSQICFVDHHVYVKSSKLVNFTRTVRDASSYELARPERVSVVPFIFLIYARLGVPRKVHTTTGSYVYDKK